MKRKVLIMSSYYVPGIKGGGPIQSIKNITEHFSSEIDFYILTSDRDLGDKTPYKNIQTEVWLKRKNVNVYYTNVSKLTFRKITKIINEINVDVIYLNSFFSYKFSIIPVVLRVLKKIPRGTLILAPRGEFSVGASSLKKGKKKLFLILTKLLGLYRNIVWHATSETEKENIKEIFGDESNIKIIDNLTADYDNLQYNKSLKKEKGSLKIVFLSRIHPKKNLKKALEFLREITGKVEFNIYGPIEDVHYWNDCEEVIEKLPKNIEVNYQGILEHEQVLNVFNAHHVFLFPTLGENYGHVISEALLGGCLLIVSDQTPWCGLSSKQVGWDINLKKETVFIESIQKCINFTNEEYIKMSKQAFNYGKESSNKHETLKLYQDLFT